MWGEESDGWYARDGVDVVRCGEKREEFRAILKSSSQKILFLFRPLFEFLCLQIKVKNSEKYIVTFIL